MRDREGALWLGLDNGVTRVETPSPMSYFNQSDGLASTAFFAGRIDGRLYVGLQSGAASLVPKSLDGKVPAHFQYIEGTGTQCWWFAKMTDPARTDRSVLLLACGDGLFDVRNNKAIPDQENGRPQLPAECDLSCRNWTRRASGLGCSTAFHRSAGSAGAGSTKAGSKAPTWRSVRCSSSRTDRCGRALAATGSPTSRSPARPVGGAARPATHVERFGTNDGLPVGGVSVYDVKGSPMFSAGVQDPHLLRFDTKTRRFMRETAFDHVVGVNYF